GELDDLGWTCPGLQVTTASGVLGGREVCARLLAAVSP
ncbi:MAG TPA: HAD family hydrolase, partial [Dermacoccus sp.]|nr:HAD family hydrolase [Dermacoccus sp.]